MKEKLFEALKTKFQGVSESTLRRIAESKAETVNEESQIQTVADGLTFQDVINSEADYRASRTAESVRSKAVSDYETRHNLKDGKPIESDPNPPKPTEPDKDMPDWAKQTVKQIEGLMNTVSALTKSQQINSKKESAKSLLAKTTIPGPYQDKWINRIDVDSEEQTIEDQVKALEEEYTSIEQAIINQKVGGKGGSKPGTTSNIPDEELSEFMDDKFGEE